MGTTHTMSYHHQDGLVLNLTDLLAPLKNCPLEELDISYNALISMVPGLINNAPRLRKLIARYNMFNNLLWVPFFFEILIHPTLEEVDLSKQGLGKPKRIPSNESPSLFDMIHEDAMTYTNEIKKS